MQNVIERVNGILKKRFKVLRFPQEVEISHAVLMIYCCAMIHNFCMSENVSFEDEFFENEDVEDDDEQNDSNLQCGSELEWLNQLAESMWRRLFMCQDPS